MNKLAKTPKLILAYDRSTFNPEDIRLLRELAPLADMVKIGLEAMHAEEPREGGACSVAYLVRDFLQDGDEFDRPVPTMWDAKLDDIGETTSRALKNIVAHEGVRYVTMHTTMSEAALRQAVKICRDYNAEPVAVTVLSDMSDWDATSCFDRDAQTATLLLAQRARDCGFRHIICPAQQLAFLKAGSLAGFHTIVVGIREKMPTGGHVHTATPLEAACLGADHIVLGSEVMGARNPVSRIKEIRAQLESAV